MHYSKLNFKMYEATTLNKFHYKMFGLQDIDFLTGISMGILKKIKCTIFVNKQKCD